jgi:ribonuclease HIII
MTSNRLDTLKFFIQEQGWGWEPGKTIPYGTQIIVTGGGDRIMVNHWPKKGTILAQGSDSPLKRKIEAHLESERPSSPIESSAEPRTGPHIGMDESGKGDWFGPLVVAAVYADDEMIEKLLRIGVRDSKKISPDTLEKISRDIENTIPPGARHVKIIDPETYNQLYSVHGNINLLLAEVYTQTAEKVWQKTHCGCIFCDQFSTRADRLENAFAEKGLPRPFQQHHAESLSMAVAAASVLASAAFKRELKRLGEKSGMDGPLPAGALNIKSLESTLRKIMKRHGRESAGAYAKLNFKPVQKILNPF